MQSTMLVKVILWSAVTYLCGFSFASDNTELSPANVELPANHTQEQVDREKAQLVERIKNLERLLADTKEKIRRRRMSLNSTVEKLGANDVLAMKETHYAVWEQYEQRRLELSRTREQQAEARTRLDVLSSMPESTAVASRESDPGSAEELNSEQIAAGTQEAKIATPEAEVQTSSDSRTRAFLVRKIEMLSKRESRLLEEMVELSDGIKKLARTALAGEAMGKTIDRDTTVATTILQEIEQARAELKAVTPE